MVTVKEFSASRWTRGNFLFPDILRIQQDCVVHVKRGIFKSDQESMIYSKIASTEVISGWGVCNPHDRIDRGHQFDLRSRVAKGRRG